LVAVGYMDPGNWATDLGGGSKFGYALLSVVLATNFMAMFLQALCAKLGIVSGRDLAQACRDAYPRPVASFLWVVCEVAIAACDLAEVLGSAIALKLLFGIPIVWGCVITVADVLVVLVLQGRGFRYVEALVITLVLTIGGCFGYLVFASGGDMGAIARGFVPNSEIVRNPEMLYIAIGILGATVMPHNLYLHSSIVQTRSFGAEHEDKREALKFAVLDSTVALLIALFINASILIVAAATFHSRGMGGIAEIQDAHRLLSPVLGAGAASALFAVALLASGQNSTLTGTLAGQIVMEGFLSFRMAPWARRLVTRMIAVVPAVVVISVFGESKVTSLLILSQVILSFQLPFAVFPLIQFTSDKKKMGAFTNSPLTKVVGYALAVLITGANGWLLWQQFGH
jgi:manganese transport protein